MWEVAGGTATRALAAATADALAEQETGAVQAVVENHRGRRPSRSEVIAAQRLAHLVHAEPNGPAVCSKFQCPTRQRIQHAGMAISAAPGEPHCEHPRHRPGVLRQVASLKPGCPNGSGLWHRVFGMPPSTA